MNRINKKLEKGEDGADSDDSDAGSDAGGAELGHIGAAAGGRDVSRKMHLKSLGYTVKSCRIAGVAQIAPRPGSLRFSAGERGLGVVATGGSDGVLRLIRGGQVEDEAVTASSITALEVSLCGHHVFASLVDGVIVTRHIIADDGTGKDEDEGGGGGSGAAGATGAVARKKSGGGGVVVRLHPQSRELRLPCSGVAITCMRLSPDGASLICGASTGAVFITKVSTVINGLIHEPAALPPAAISAKPLAMVPLEDLRDRNSAILQLEEKVADTVKSAKFRVMMLEGEYEEKLQAAESRYDEAVAEREQARRDMEAMRLTMERVAKENRDQMEATHMLAAEELEASYERRLVMEIDRFKRLQSEVTDYKLTMEEKMQALRESHDTTQAESNQASTRALQSAEERRKALEAGPSTS